MAEIVGDCPRCGANSITFDVYYDTLVGVQYKWQRWWEVFAVCRRCGRSTTFKVKERNYATNETIVDSSPLHFVKGSIGGLVEIDDYLSIKDNINIRAPEFLPADVDAAFREAATCIGVKCWNAAGTMFRLCIDLATRDMLPKEDRAGLNPKTRRDLGLRLPWLFDNRFIPEDLRPLSACIRQDGNDGAHAGTLSQIDAEDLQDFSTALLERIFTEKERLKMAAQRREDRRKPKAD